MKKLVFLLTLTVITLTNHAQVTIGSSREPSNAALLELKTQDAINPATVTDDANITSTKGGFVLPRVKLKDLNTLEPFIPLSDQDWLNASTSKIKEKHAGLMVYNINTASPFAQGIYTWDGGKWVICAMDIKNGLHLDGNIIKLGGTLTDDETTIDLDTKNLVFDLTNASTDDDKGLMIKNLQTLSVDSKGLVVDGVTGKIGLNPGIPAKIAFLQSDTQTYLSSLSTGGSDDSDNSSRTYTIPWNITTVPSDKPSTGGDMATNNLVKFIPSENAFELMEDAAVELSGYIGYVPRATSETGAGLNPSAGGDVDKEVYRTTIVNASIQTKKEGGSLYTNCTSVRGTFLRPTTPYRQTLSIPPALYVGKKGDRIRMVVIPRPKSGSTELGVSHEDPRLVVPYGTKYSKSLKIIAQ